jgi:probable selenium-dependent hydroxylase accessory protein YqeC
MQDSFYRNFISEQDKVITFIGGGGKTTLIHRLSKDCQSLGKKVIILSLYPYIAPLDAKILISSSVSTLKIKITKAFKTSKILQIGKKINEGVVENFSIQEIKKLIIDLPGDHIFLEADSTKGRSISGYNRVSSSILPYSDRYINIVGADALNQQKNSNWIAHQDEFWKNKKIIVPMDISVWMKSHPLFGKLAKKSISSTFYINKVENIYIENLAIPLAKSIKLAGADNVLIGSVFNSNLHLIR